MRGPRDVLAVAVSTGDDWRRVGTDRVGEPLLRIALQHGNSAAAAARAAAGWGNDSLQLFRRTGGSDDSGFVWTIRWDDAANATAFAAAARDHLDARGTRTGEGWRLGTGEAALHRPAASTTVLVFGPPAFRDALALSAPAAGGISVTLEADA